MLGSLLTSRAIKSASWGRWAAGGDVGPGGSLAVTEKTATQLLAVYGSITQIADVIGAMPVDHLSSMTGTEVSNRAAWLDRPNIEMSWQTWVVSAIWSILVDGNIFAVVIRNPRGQVLELWILDPTKVRIEQVPGQRPRFYVDGKLFDGEMLHIPGYVWPGTCRGLNPIQNAAMALGWGLSTQAYGQAFMDNNAVPPIVIKAPGFPDKDQRDDLRENWNRKHKGPRNAGRVGLLWGGADVQQLSISPADAQFLEAKRFSATEIAANLFHLPPDFVGTAIEGKSITYQNLDMRWTELIRRACIGWMSRLEQQMSYQLLPRPQYIKLRPEVFMRADTKTRFETYRIANPEARWLTQAEIRAYEDLPPLAPGELPPGPAAGPPPGSGTAPPDDTGAPA